MCAGQRLIFVMQKYIFAPPEYDIIDGNVALAGDINSGGNYNHLEHIALLHFSVIWMVEYDDTW